jgi:hypothetical protein
MNAAQALQAARAAGIQVKIDGVDLLLSASAPPSAAVLEGLSRHKVHVLALLRLEKVEWTLIGGHFLTSVQASLSSMTDYRVPKLRTKHSPAASSNG